MEILRKIKSLPPLSAGLSTFMLHSPQLQLLYIFLMKQQIPLYNNIMDTFSVKSQFAIQLLVFFQFVVNSIQLIYLIMRVLFFGAKKSAFENMILSIIRTKPKLLLVITLHWNILTYNHCPPLYITFAIANITFTFLQLFTTQLTSVSYRFQEQHLTYRKNTSLIESFLLLPIIYLINYAGLELAACVIAMRCVAKVYFNRGEMENAVVAYCDYFWPLVQLALCVIEWFRALTGMQFFANRGMLHFTVIMCLIVYAAHSLAVTMVLLVPKYHLKKSTYFSKNQSEQSLLQTQGSFYVNQKQEKQFILTLRIMAKMYLARKKSQQQYERSEKQSSTLHNLSSFLDDEFNTQWWLQFNRIIINHKIYCNNITCPCLRLSQRQSHQNSQVVSTIFIEIMLTSLQKILESSHSTKLSIIEKYFLIEILQKPIKNYYQLIRLKGEVKKKEEVLEVEALMVETRQLFGHLFTKEGVKNQELQIDEVLHFQDSLKTMKIQLVELSGHYKKFYDLFSNSFVETIALKKATNQLISIKRVFSQQLASYMDKFSRNLEFLTFCLIYYKYFDQYTHNTDKIAKNIEVVHEINLGETFGRKNYPGNNNRKNIDVFDPMYGAVKIDLVYRPGEILSVTRNVCNLLGRKRQQVEGEKINKIMPFMFARYHDKFLKQFIEKGSISMLKRKERVFYAKNSRKFIFPITVRLKVEYMSSQGFSASSLIKKTPTNSEFILINNYGKIEEISQGIYKLLFQKSLKEEISKVKRLNIYKMLLSLNHFVKNPTDGDDREYEGTITTTQSQDSLEAYYKFIELSSSKNAKKSSEASETSKNLNTSQQLTNRSNTSTFLSAQSFSSFFDKHSTGNTSQPIFDSQKCCNGMKQTLKDYFAKLNLQKIRAYKVNYKFYDIITTEFKCKVLQIVSVKEKMPEALIKVQLSKQIVEVGELYGMVESDFNQYRSQRVKNDNDGHFKSMKRLLDINGQLDHLSPVSMRFGEEQESLDTSLEIQNNSKIHLTHRQFENLQSVGSSMNPNKQNFQRKQSIITSFGLQISINPNLQIALTFLMLLAAISLAIICGFSTTLKPDYEDLQHDNLIISNFKVNFEFRLAVQEMYHFYHPYDLHAPEFLISKKHILTDSMKQQLKNSIKWIKNDLSGELYFDLMQLIHADTGFAEERPIITTLVQIYSMFLMTEEQGEHLSENYMVIRDHLDDLSQHERQAVLLESENLRIKIHTIVGFYASLLIILTVIFALINFQSVDNEQKIIDFLPFINTKQAKEKINFYDSLMDFLKEKQEFSAQDIEEIQYSTVSYFNQPTSRLKQRSSNSLLKGSTQNLQEKSFLPNQSKNEANSRFIRVVKGDQRLLTAKNSLIIILMIGICLTVIIETQLFFLSAHNKFTAYINLKQSAMTIQNMAPRTLLTYLINLDKIVHSEDLIPFPDNYYESANIEIFNLRLNLAKNQVNGTELGNSLNKHFNSKICELIECDDQDVIAKDSDIYDLSYRFVNSLDYMRKIILTLKNFPQPKIEIMKWVDDDNVLELLKGVEHILQLMKKSEKDITELFTQQINIIGYQLLFLSLTLIPILILSLYFLRKKFLSFVYERLQCSQNIYKQFSWPILSQNTYAINYFQTKLKNSKNY